MGLEDLCPWPEGGPSLGNPSVQVEGLGPIPLAGTGEGSQAAFLLPLPSPLGRQRADPCSAAPGPSRPASFPSRTRLSLRGWKGQQPCLTCLLGLPGKV